MKYMALLIMGMLAGCAAGPADSGSGQGGGPLSNKLVTPTLWAQTPVHFACNLTNIGGETHTVRTRIVNGNSGQALLDKSASLAPFHTMDTTVEGLKAPGGPIYCEFTVPGDKHLFRGVAKLWRGPKAENSSDITAVAAE